MSGLFACYAANELRTDSLDLPRNPPFSFSKTFCECGCGCGVTGLQRYQEDLLNSETSSQVGILRCLPVPNENSVQPMAGIILQSRSRCY